MCIVDWRHNGVGRKVGRKLTETSVSGNLFLCYRNRGNNQSARLVSTDAWKVQFIALMCQ